MFSTFLMHTLFKIVNIVIFDDNFNLRIFQYFTIYNIIERLSVKSVSFLLSWFENSFFKIHLSSVFHGFDRQYHIFKCPLKIRLCKFLRHTFYQHNSAYNTYIRILHKVCFKQVSRFVVRQL